METTGIIYINGDLLKADVDVIAHGCNCIQTMGAGIAKYIAQVYPEVQKADKHFQPINPRERLGKIDAVKVHAIPGSKIQYVVNCYTQLEVGEGVQISYSAIRKSMQALHDFVAENNLSLAIPKIGAGLGGGDWKRIAQDITEIFTDREVKVYSLR
jgi:O-acetyl-ADP-ribose deacetylase (regulator of RNase III)